MFRPRFVQFVYISGIRSIFPAFFGRKNCVNCAPAIFTKDLHPANLVYDYKYIESGVGPRKAPSLMLMLP